MHASIEQLLALRDGEPLDAHIARHTAQCPDCARELDGLRETRAALARLPTLPAPDRWDQVARRVASSVRHKPAHRRQWALAAGALLAAAALAFLLTRPEPFAPDMPVPVAQPDLRPARPDATAESEAIAQRIEALVARSAQLEGRLRELKSQAPAVMRLGHEAGAARLQSRLSALDAGHAQLVHDPGVDDLRQVYWNERVRLLDSMVDIEQAERVQRDAARYRIVPASH